jgi:hypothetical protein
MPSGPLHANGGDFTQLADVEPVGRALLELAPDQRASDFSLVDRAVPPKPPRLGSFPRRCAAIHVEAETRVVA